MINIIHILIQAGDGGNGCESYFHRKDRKIIPNGGDGGKGGNVIFRADPNAPPISDLRYKQHIIAESGGHGSSSRKRGRNGKDLVILVPRGTRLYDRKRNCLIRDLMHDQEEVIVAEGGEGGTGNHRNRGATLGKKGAIYELEITFRIMTDVFLSGLPNSGASSLLNCLTRAHVKTEEYPFTSRIPELGVCQLSDYEQLTICVLPSLYRGSHEGRGLGNDFLKHLEIARFILFVIDPVSEFAGSLKEGLEILKNEIGIFNAQYRSIPYGIIVNKMDLPAAQERVKAESWDPKAPCFFVSTLTGEGLESLKDFLKGLIPAS